jgi:hypothetical protein
VGSLMQIGRRNPDYALEVFRIRSSLRAFSDQRGVQRYPKHRMTGSLCARSTQGDAAFGLPLETAADSSMH